MEKSPSWEANGHTAGHIPHIVWKEQYRLNNGLNVDQITLLFKICRPTCA